MPGGAAAGRMRLATAAAALAAAALLVAGCGGDTDASGEAGGTTAETTTVVEPLDGPLTVQQALDAGDGDRTVRGWVVPVGTGLKLCTTRADTEPPRCGEPSLVLDGYAGTISAIEEVDVDGTVEGGTLVFDPQSLLDRGNNR